MTRERAVFDEAGAIDGSRPLEQVADALVLGRLGVIAEQLTAHDLCP